MFLAIGVGSGSAAVAQGPATAVDTTKKAGVPDAPIADYNAPKRYIVNKVTVSGVKFLDPEIIANTSGLHKGDTIMLPSDYISSAMRQFRNLPAGAPPCIQMEYRGCEQKRKVRVDRQKT